MLLKPTTVSSRTVQRWSTEVLVLGPKYIVLTCAAKPGLIHKKKKKKNQLLPIKKSRHRTASSSSYTYIIKIVPRLRWWPLVSRLGWEQPVMMAEGWIIQQQQQQQRENSNKNLRPRGRRRGITTGSEKGEKMSIIMQRRKREVHQQQ